MSNDFQVFAGGGGANVITQAQFLALSALGPGFTTGVAASAQLNKVFRQASTMGALLGQIMANVTGQNVQDQGVLTALLQQYNSTAQLVEYAGVDSGSGNSYTITFTGGTAGIFDGERVRFRASHANTGAATLSVNGSSAAAIWSASHNPLVGGEIVVNSTCECIWNSAINSTGAWVLTDASAGSLAPFPAAYWGYYGTSLQTSSGTTTYSSPAITPVGIGSGISSGTVTVANGGVYAVLASVGAFNTVANQGTVTATLTKNGSTTNYTGYWGVGTGQDYGTVTAFGIVQCTAGDQLALFTTLTAAANTIASVGNFIGMRIR